MYKSKYQDALDFIEKNSCHQKKACNECDFNRICNSFAKEKLDVLQELVDKATPKKYELKSEMVDGVKWTHAICPNCKEVIDEFEYYPYCPNCGQAVDWSDEE